MISKSQHSFCLCFVSAPCGTVVIDICNPTPDFLYGYWGFEFIPSCPLDHLPVPEVLIINFLCGVMAWVRHF